jgi:putative redox protein
VSDYQPIVVTRRSGQTYTTDVQIRDHQLIADEPPEKGGEDLGPTPMELLLASLATCTAITLEMYAGRKQWPLDGVSVEINREPDPAAEQKADLIRQRVTLTGPLTEDQRSRLLLIAGRCPVHRLVAAAPRMIEELVESTERTEAAD